MADSPSTASTPPPNESPAQAKARLRRERRAAKLQEGGASRLQAITSLQGGSHRDVGKDVPVKQTATPPAGSRTDTPDPEEIDISQHHYTPPTQPRQPSPFAFNGTSTPPFPGAGPGSDPSQDPMMAMLQQMMGGAGPGGMPGGPGGFPGGFPGGPGQPGQPGQPGGLPPDLANLFSTMQGNSTPEPSPDQSSAWIWRIIHSVFSLGLAIYIVSQTSFTGSKRSRSLGPAEDDWTVDSSSAETFKHFFYLFATFEVVLQSSRYFIEKGQLQGSGLISTIAQLLPQPYGGYVKVIGRYSVIYSTVVSDAMVVVFVLGATSWWRGGVMAA